MNPTIPPSILNPIIRITALSPDQIRSNCRKENYVYARRIIAELMREQAHPIKSIAQAINRHRTTVINILKTNPDQYTYNPKYRTLYLSTCMLTPEG